MIHRCLPFLSGMLLVAGLWQLEMIDIHRSWGFDQFSLPFGYTVPWWWARDLCYAMILASFLLTILYFIERKE